MLTYQTFFKGKLGDLRCWCRQFQKDESFKRTVPSNENNPGSNSA